MSNNQDESKDLDSAFFEGKDFARRTTPRIPTRRELEELTDAYLRATIPAHTQVDQEDFESAWEELNLAYIAIFDRYKAVSGFHTKIALVCLEDGTEHYFNFSWMGGQCKWVWAKKLNET